MTPFKVVCISEDWHSKSDPDPDIKPRLDGIYTVVNVFNTPLRTRSPFYILVGFDPAIGWTHENFRPVEEDPYKDITAELARQVETTPERPDRINIPEPQKQLS